MATWKVIHLITRLDRGGSAQNTLLTAQGHDRSRFEPLVVTGRAGRWDAQGGDQATQENLRLLEFLRRPDWAKELGAAASEQIDARFGISAMVQAVEAVYVAALREGGRK
ncbi:MAG: hypothetical protein HYY20_10235 [Candidatus Tectomicrobia bacterium]|uniref:Glycosyltransferase family 1 protein n=1 Tax=Tectimicrobiota bacterium TaxID=2528274 RepID=A0A932CQ62_UNCTE|nr:hypothetical protein [Candidatus Tectomicrobia bacterium]